MLKRVSVKIKNRPKQKMGWKKREKFFSGIIWEQPTS